MNRIKYLRELNGELQSDLAKILDVTSVAIGNYENEKRDIPTEYLKILAQHFNCSIDYILCKTDIRNHEEINIDEADIAFASGVKGLNETNKMIIRNTLEALLAKQEKDEGENK